MHAVRVMRSSAEIEFRGWKDEKFSKQENEENDFLTHKTDFVAMSRSSSLPSNVVSSSTGNLTHIISCRK